MNVPLNAMGFKKNAFFACALVTGVCCVSGSCALSQANKTNAAVAKTKIFFIAIEKFVINGCFKNDTKVLFFLRNKQILPAFFHKNRHFFCKY